MRWQCSMLQNIDNRDSVKHNFLDVSALDAFVRGDCKDRLKKGGVSTFKGSVATILPPSHFHQLSLQQVHSILPQVVKGLVKKHGCG